MIRFSSSIVLGLTAALVFACGGGNKTSSLGASPDASATDDAGTNGGSSNAGAGNGGSPNGGTNGMDATAPDASPSSTPDASLDAGPTGSNDSGVLDGGADDGGAGDADAGAVCGNGDVEGIEGCDDGNTDSGDGCTADCWAVELTQTVTVGPLLGLAITDNGYSGAEASMACASLVAGAWTGADISSVTAQVGMVHTFVGDLVIKLISPANTVVTLVSRPGYTEVADDGAETGYGDSSDLVITHPITFSQSAGVSSELMGDGANITSTQAVCQTGGVCDFLPSNGAATAGNLSAFNGQTSPGTWKLCVGDVTSGDLGTIDAVTLTINH